MAGYLDGFLCRKLFWYNNHVWGYFISYPNQDNDAWGYFDTTIGSGQWILKQDITYGFQFNIDDSLIPPQFSESNKRLLFLSELGVQASPKLETD